MLSRERGLRPAPVMLCFVTPINIGVRLAHVVFATLGAAVCVFADDRVRNLASGA
jgi:hypothetical protein